MKSILIKKNSILQDVLQWHSDNIEIIGGSNKLNADCMIHAALEDDKERLQLLYSHGYRLGTVKNSKMPITIFVHKHYKNVCVVCVIHAFTKLRLQKVGLCLKNPRWCFPKT